MSFHLPHLIFTDEFINSSRVAKACSGTDHLGVHLRGQCINQFGNEVVGNMYTLIGYYLDGDKTAGAIKHLTNLFL